jgi:hypothetical protein
MRTELPSLVHELDCEGGAKRLEIRCRSLG